MMSVQDDTTLIMKDVEQNFNLSSGDTDKPLKNSKNRIGFNSNIVSKLAVSASVHVVQVFVTQPLMLISSTTSM